MSDDNYFDSEKAFKDAVEPSRRAFLKHMVALGAGAVAAAKSKVEAKPAPISPDRTEPIITSGYAQEVPPPAEGYTFCDPLAYTFVPIAYTSMSYSPNASLTCGWSTNEEGYYALRKGR